MDINDDKSITNSKLMSLFVMNVNELSQYLLLKIIFTYPIWSQFSIDDAIVILYFIFQWY